MSLIVGDATVPASPAPVLYTPVMLRVLIVAVGSWCVFAPESVRRFGIALHRPLGRSIEPPRALFVRLIGLTLLLIVASESWSGRW